MSESEGRTELAIRWLEPGEVTARWEPAAARFSVKLADREEIPDARAALAFPVTRPGRFIDLCNGKNESVGMLRSLKGLEAGSRKAIEAALEARYLIPHITRVEELIDTSPFVLRWRVATDRGERAFHTESPREAVKYQTPDRIRITDLAGNHYDLPSISGLDPASRALLAAFL